MATLWTKTENDHFLPDNISERKTERVRAHTEGNYAPQIH